MFLLRDFPIHRGRIRFQRVLRDLEYFDFDRALSERNLDNIAGFHLARTPLRLGWPVHCDPRRVAGARSGYRSALDQSGNLEIFIQPHGYFVSTLSLSALPGLNTGMVAAAISIASPVRGL